MTSQAEKFNQRNRVSATGQHEKGIPKGVKARFADVEASIRRTQRITLQIVAADLWRAHVLTSHA